MGDDKKGKKRSKAFYVKSSAANKKMRRDKSLDVGMRGFLLTCNHMENLCVRDGYSLLGEYADSLYGPEKLGEDKASSENESESDCDDIEASLKKEVAQMKQKREKKEMRFEAIDSGAKNVIFIRTKLPDPTELVHHILTDTAKTQTCKSRHIMRFLPVNLTCRTTLDDLAKNAPDFLHPYFHAEGIAPTTFAIRIKIRNNASIHRGPIIKLLASLVGGQDSKHLVALDDPELSVMVEIIKNVCCLSVVRDFNELRRYNLQEIVSDGGAAWKGQYGRVAKTELQRKEKKDATNSEKALEEGEKRRTEHEKETEVSDANRNIDQGEEKINLDQTLSKSDKTSKLIGQEQPSTTEDVQNPSTGT